LTRRLNIINVDFIEQFGWVDAIVRLNCNYPEIWPKTWPPTIVPQVAAQSFTWTLKAINKNGILYVEATTGSPFRATGPDPRLLTRGSLSGRSRGEGASLEVG
jgi:hypothetical protein